MRTYIASPNAKATHEPKKRAMNDIINLENLLISTPHGSKNEYESVAVFEESDPYIRWLSIEFALEDDEGSRDVSVYGETEKASNAARLSGALILGEQATIDEQDLIRLCDDCSGDLYEMAEELDREGLLEDFDGMGYNILYVHSLELSSELIDASNLIQFFTLVPRYVFQYTNVMPQIICYQVASVEGYYEEAASQTHYDPRSVDKTSPQLFIKNGFTTSESGILLYRIVNDGIRAYEEDMEFDEEDQEGDQETDFDNPNPSMDEETREWYDDFRDSLEKDFALSKRSLLEDPYGMALGSNIVLIPRTAPRKLIQYVNAALFAYDLGIRADYALERFASDLEANIAPIHELFQEMYFAGKTHIDSTIERMHSKDVPSAGETFADAALARAANTYYVAAFLYREGHLIEAHAMSRLMLEQIAWAFAVCEVEDYSAAKKVSPSRAIGMVKEKIKPVGRMYGELSKYVHLPIQGHYEFIDLSQRKTEVVQQFGAHSYAQGAIISRLADYWAAVYEYTQARHFDELENWTESASGLELNTDRPFLSIIQPIRKKLMETYETGYPSYSEFIRSHWTVGDEVNDRPDDTAASPPTENG